MFNKRRIGPNLQIFSTKALTANSHQCFFSILRYWDIERMIQYFTIIEMTSIQRSLSIVVDRQTPLTKKHGAQDSLRVWTHIFSTNIYVFISYAKTFNTKCLWSKNPRQVQTPQLWEQTKALVGTSAHFSENKISKLIKILLAKITSELGKLPSAKGTFEFQTLVCIKDVAFW